MSREDQNEYLKLTENEKISHEQYCQICLEKGSRLLILEENLF